MTADPQDARNRIVAFAAMVGGTQTPAVEKAIRRGWLDDDGSPTSAGRELLSSLDDQSATRTVFRGA